MPRMARYRNPELAEQLASEYVLGTLRGGARVRFESLMRYDPGLRSAVAQWEARLAPLAGTAAGIAPPARVWHAIEHRLRRAGREPGWWESLAFWRGLAAAGAMFSLALAVLVRLAPQPGPPMSTVTVMSDEAGRPAMVVAWPPMAAMAEPHLRVRIVQDHPTMPQTSSWELWLLPGGVATPVSLGLVTLDPVQVVKVPRAATGKMGDACGMALSLEPAGGSPTGAPTGPVIFKGQCLKML